MLHLYHISSLALRDHHKRGKQNDYKKQSLHEWLKEISVFKAKFVFAHVTHSCTCELIMVETPCMRPRQVISPSEEPTPNTLLNTPNMKLIPVIFMPID